MQPRHPRRLSQDRLHTVSLEGEGEALIDRWLPRRPRRFLLAVVAAGRRVLGARPGAGDRCAGVPCQPRVADPAALPRRPLRHAASVRDRLRAQFPGRYRPPRHCRRRGAPPHVACARSHRRRGRRRPGRAVLRVRLWRDRRGRRPRRRLAAVRHVVRGMAHDGLRLGDGGGLHAAHPLGGVQAPLPRHDRGGAARPAVPAVPADERAGRHHRAGVLDRQHPVRLVQRRRAVGLHRRGGHAGAGGRRLPAAARRSCAAR